MKFKDIKIITQLRFVLGFLVLEVLILSAVAWYQTTKIWEGTEGLYQHPLKTRRAVSELSRSILSMRVNMRDFFLVGDSNTRATVLNEMAVNQNNVTKEIEMLKQCYLGPRQDIDGLVTEFTRWVSIREESIHMAYSGAFEAAKRRHLPGGVAPTQAIKVLASLEKISDFAKSRAEQFYQSAVKEKKALMARLLLLAFAIIVLSTGMLYMFLRAIQVPLGELKASTDKFHGGDLDARCPYVSQNEFGVLASSFNNLAESLEKELNMNNQSVRLSSVMLSIDDARLFCRSVLTSLLEFSGSNLGAVFVLDEELNEYHLFESIGMDSSRSRAFSARELEGEFGPAISSGKIQYLTLIPETTRFIFTAVSGSMYPTEIVTIPIVRSNRTIAIISLATISTFKKNTLPLLNYILPVLSARMDGILAYRKIIEFSRLMEDQNRELANRAENLTTANQELEVQKKELATQSAELTGQNIELEMQKRQLNEANRLKTNFLSNMSHELRTPLNSVIALSGVLSRRLAGKVPEEEFSYLDVIERNGKQLLALINEILDLSRIEAGYEEIDVKTFRLDSLVREIVELMKPQADQKKITLKYSGSPDIPDISSDPVKCRHIIQNLVANAVKFTEKGTVEISVEQENRNILLKVTDTGIGIDEENLPMIFDEFRQADGSNSRKYGGAGLGLAIAKKYAGMLGASISVVSVRRKGSCFTLSLPILFSPGDARDALPLGTEDLISSGYTEEPVPGTVRGRSILLVEDSEAIIIQMKDILEPHGFQIEVARNGTEALERISVNVPDSMILDLMMPGIDGFEVLRTVRENEKSRMLPVIILTAKYITKQELAFLKHNGIHQLIRKGDINKEQLLETIIRMMTPLTEHPTETGKAILPVPVHGTPLILVVEDNPDNLLTMKALIPGNIKILEAGDGITGVELAKSSLPDLILMDIALPGMNGIQALMELRKERTTRMIPVIAVSASAMKGDREHFLKFGFNDYISKPIDSGLFPEIIEKWVGRSA